MRAVFVGGSALTVMAARFLLARRHEVVIVERDREVIEALVEELDAGFIHGDGSKPALLRESDPAATDVLLCLTGNDQANILAGLVGRSLGFRRVIVKIEDEEFEHICIELGLEDTIIPSRTIGRHLADSFEGRDLFELSGVIKDEACTFSFVASRAEAGPVAELELPADSRVICLYREERFVPVVPESRIEVGDEVILIAHCRRIQTLRHRWGNDFGQKQGE